MDVPMIKIWPRDRNTGLRHPSSPTRALPDDGDFWPDDQFTHRRIRDGGVLLEDPRAGAPQSAPVPDEHSPAAGDHSDN